jgi:UDPglucose 6-dehydrogenase
VEEVNEKQKNILFEKFVNYYKGDVKGRKVALWGLAFKPETDDMRDAPSLVLIDSLLKAGCQIAVYDPIAMDECRRRIGDVVTYFQDMYATVLDADAIFHVTEWKEFRMPNWQVIKRLIKLDAVLIDGRNVFDKNELEGINYLRIG